MLGKNNAEIIEYCENEIFFTFQYYDNSLHIEATNKKEYMEWCTTEDDYSLENGTKSGSLIYYNCEDKFKILKEYINQNLNEDVEVKMPNKIKSENTELCIEIITQVGLDAYDSVIILIFPKKIDTSVKTMKIMNFQHNIINEKINDIEKTNTETLHHQDKINDNIVDIKHQLSDIKDDFDRILISTTTLSTKIKEMESTCEKIPLLGTKIITMESVHGKFPLLETKFTDFEKKIALEESKLALVDSKFVPVESKITSVESKNSLLETKIASLESSNGKIVSLETKIVSLETKLATLETLVCALEIKIPK